MLLVPALAAGLLVAAAPAASAFASASGHPHPASPAWKLLPNASTQQFRGLAAVSSKVAWLAGTAGIVLRTSDGGRHWKDVSPPGTSALQFRDIEAWDARHAVALTIGNGTDSRVYVTSDGGAHWQTTFTNTDPNAFYDCLAFWDPSNGLAVSDAVDGKMRLISTHDGGRHWSVMSGSGMPPAVTGEGAFAASGSCLITSGRSEAWIATTASRVFHTLDRGRHWTLVTTPVPSGDGGAAGVFSLDARRGTVLAVGGDFLQPTLRVDNSATSYDRGRTWHLAAVTPGGYRSSVAWLGSSRSPARAAVAVGPTGSDISYDRGRTWHPFDTGYFDTVHTAADGTVWASGTGGRVARLSI